MKRILLFFSFWKDWLLNTAPFIALPLEQWSQLFSALLIFLIQPHIFVQGQAWTTILLIYASCKDGITGMHQLFWLRWSLNT
jgi:hypothetical protein